MIEEANSTFTRRFWKKVNKTDECWLWTGAKWKFGHGGIRLAGKGSRTIGAHVASYRIHVGPVPEGMFVLHHCDVPSCVRPDHLYIGTQADNMKDRAYRFRNTTLNADIVREVRRLRDSGMRPGEIGTMLGLTRSQVHGILSGLTFTHV